MSILLCLLPFCERSASASISFDGEGRSSYEISDSSKLGSLAFGALSACAVWWKEIHRLGGLARLTP